jgi:transcriptional regulator GlxA family with amidase domain
MRAGIFVFRDVEVLDFCGPFEVLSVARLDEARRRDTASPFEVVLVAETTEPVRTAGGMTVLPHTCLEDCPPLDVLVVPGGWGTRALLENRPIIDWIAARAADARVVASVCTGALLLGRAGLLEGRRATTHWWALDRMEELFPSTTVERDARFVEDGPVLTSAGISAGIDMSLVLVARLVGEDVARATAKYMEYPYPDHARRRIEVA